MSKKALVIKTEDFTNYLTSIESELVLGDKFIGSDASDVLQFKPFLVERSICETDKNTLQIIPYITLAYLKDTGSNIPNPADPDTKFFIYTRGAVGNEGRLHGNCSVGLGGHIEEEPTEVKTFDNVITEAALRELEEEVGLKLLGFDSSESICSCGNLFFDTSNPVGEVHLGISITLFTSPDQLNETEEGVITKGQWLTYSEIMDLVNDETDQIVLEEWTKMYFDYNIKNEV